MHLNINKILNVPAHQCSAVITGYEIDIVSLQATAQIRIANRQIPAVLELAELQAIVQGVADDMGITRGQIYVKTTKRILAALVNQALASLSIPETVSDTDFNGVG